MIAWWWAFVVTQLAEAPVYALSQRREHGVGRALALGLVPSAVTHPLLWMMWWRLLDLLGDPTLTLWLAEGAVTASEALLWRLLTRQSLARCTAVSLAANLWSIAVGETLRATIGWP